MSVFTRRSDSVGRMTGAVIAVLAALQLMGVAVQITLRAADQ